MSKLWEIITTVRDMGGTMEDVRALMAMGADQESAPSQAEQPAQVEEQAPVENSVETVDSAAQELEALRLENVELKGRLQTYNILHASTGQPASASPSDAAVQVGLNMIK